MTIILKVIHQTPLTAVVVQGSKFDTFLSQPCAVVHLHLQFVPSGFLQVQQVEAFRKRGALHFGPHRAVQRTIFQSEGGDWTTAVIPANQVEFDACSINATKQLLVFGELWLCDGWRRWRRTGKVFFNKITHHYLRNWIFKTKCTPFPWVFASIISLIRPGPTAFWAVSVNLYQVPQLRFSKR